MTTCPQCRKLISEETIEVDGQVIESAAYHRCVTPAQKRWAADYKAEMDAKWRAEKAFRESIPAWSESV
jgi:hypothetical protein